jgi:O-antigen/teichoic acid export membrane protein
MKNISVNFFQLMLKPQILDAATAFVIRILSAVLAYGLFILVARVSSLNEYEDFAFVFTLIGFFGPLASLGGASLAFKNLSHIINDEDNYVALKKVKYIIVTTILGAFVFSFFAISILYLRAESIKNEFQVLILAVLVLLSGLTEIFFAFNRMIVDTKISLVLKEIIWRIFFILTVLVLYKFNTISIESLISALGFSYLVMFISLFWRVKNTVLTSMKVKLDWNVIHRNEMLVYLSLSILGMAFVHIDNLIIGALMPSGNYGAFFSAQRVIQVIYFFSQSIGVFAGTTVTIAYKKGDLKSITRMSRLSAIVAGGFALLTSLIIAYFSGDILSLFKKEFATESLILIILLIGPVIYTFGGYHSIIPTFCGAETQYLKWRLCLILFFISLKLLVVLNGNLLIYALVVSFEACAVTFLGMYISKFRCNISCL